MFEKIFKNTQLKKDLDLHIKRLINEIVEGEVKKLENKLFAERLKVEWLTALVEKSPYITKSLTTHLSLKCYTDSELSKMIFLENFEQSEIDFVKKILMPGDIFVDIGANIGLFTVIAADLVGEKGQVLSFEPTPKSFERLVDNVKLNGLTNVKAFELGISDTIGSHNLNISLDGFDAWNSLTKPSGGTQFSTLTIQTDSLDNIAEELPVINNAVLFKIDVEGWENKVLLGGTEVFAKDDAPILLVEFTEENAVNAGYTTKDLYEQIVALGYELFIYNGRIGTLVPEPYQGPYPYKNLVALKKVHLRNPRLKVID